MQSKGRVVAEAEEVTPAGPDPFALAELFAVKRAMKELRRRTFPGMCSKCAMPRGKRGI